MAPPRLDQLLGEAVEDAGEETFLLFSQSLPSHNLGFVDAKASTVDFEIGGRSLTLRQSPGLLNSRRESGTTGAVLWKVAPLLGEWLVSSPKWLKDADILHPASTVVELGCGITGLLGIVLAEKVSNYVLTDQSWVMKTLRDNVNQNMSSQMPPRRLSKNAHAGKPPNLHLIPLDWETDSPDLILGDVPNADNVDLVIICDCIYNEHLVGPLVQTLVDLCKIGPASRPTSVMMAQQLRSDIVFETFLNAMLQQFIVWRVPDSMLSTALQSGSGFAVHFAQLKKNGTDSTSGRV